MKKLIGLFLLGLCVGVRADDVLSDAQAPYTERGVSITKWIEGSNLKFTNTVSEPWYVESIASESGYTNTFTFTVVRIYDIGFQYRPDDVTTNIFGQVETNTYTEVTNMTYRVWTGQVYSVIASNAQPVAVAPKFTIKPEDVIIVGQSDTNGKPVIISGSR